MPKPSTLPTLFDEVKQISITKLKEWDYLKPEQIKSGVLNWSRDGNNTGSISILVNTNSKQPFIELDYKSNDVPRKYKVRLVSVDSNLGKGKIWYFLCPNTYKQCRKLYLKGGYFLHREAFNGCMYESQTYSKNYRGLGKVYDSYFKLDNLYEQLYKKNFKKTYAGKPTKRYLKLMEQIKKAERIKPEELTKMMLM
jgi:hypothetical protein